MSDNPVESSGGNVKLKPAPIPFKQRQTSEATAATESSFVSPSDTGVSNNIDSSKMMSKSFGGGPSAFLSSVITSTPPAPGVVQRYSSASHSSISYSGYLFKRSNLPHRNAAPERYQQQQQQGGDDYEFNYEHSPLHHCTQQYASTADRHLYVDPSGLPSLPNMPGVFAAGSNRDSQQHQYPEPFLVSDHQWPDFHSPLADHFQQQHQHVQSAPPVAPSMAVGELSKQEERQQTKSGDDQNQNRDEKNPFQLGLESAAAFFGIRLKEEDSKKQQQNKEKRNVACDDTMASTKEPILSSPIQPKPTSPIAMPSRSSTTTIPLAQPAALNAIPIPTQSANTSHSSHPHSAYRKESFREASHRRHSAPQEATPPSSELMESSLSFGTHANNSVGTTASPSGIPQDFYDPKDGHLWRAKYCVLEDGVLYFYRNSNDGDSMEAAAERKQTHQEELGGMKQSDAASGNFGTTVTPSPLPPASTLSRRRSSAQDLSKSPMIRPMVLHHLEFSAGGSDSGAYPPNRHCMWEKRVFLDCIEEVRTAEQQFGKNSFELTAVTDDEAHVDKLVLRAPNVNEMNEWIFQFHRSLASFMRNIMDVFASTSSSGVFLDIHRPSNMLAPASSSHRMPLQMAASIPHSPSEKQLQRLIAMSPRFQHHFHGLSGTPIQPTLSHGHGRTSLRRRTNLKRTSSEGASVASTPDTDDGADDSPQHQFAFREPSPLQGAPESISPPRQFLIPPPTTGAASTSADASNLRSHIVSLENRHRISTPTPPQEFSDPELSAPPSEVPEMERPKPATGKYVPPHLRNKLDGGSSTFKSKYIPPHLRSQQEHGPKKYVPPSMRKDVENATSCTPPTSSSVMSLAERAQLAPSTPHRRDSPVGTMMSTEDSLDVVEKSTIEFVRGGCADPLLIKGSVLDEMYIPRKASRVKKASTEAFGSFGGDQDEKQNLKLLGSSQKKSLLRWEIGAVSECGVRDHNEDAFLITNDLLTAFDSGTFDDSPQSFWTKEAESHSTGLFAIFDGHCGNQAARFAVERLAHFVHEELRQNPLTESPFSPVHVKAILRDAITKMDDAFCTVCQEDGRDWESGATALVAMIVNDHLVIANVGDCRGVVCRTVSDTSLHSVPNEWSILEDIDDDELKRVAPSSRACYWKEVTSTHSPAAEKEKQRIESANGWITTDTEIPIAQLRRMDFLDEDVIAIVKRCLHYPTPGNTSAVTDSERSTKECKAAPQRILHISRVCGELAVSRALGDRDFKSRFNSLSSQHDGEAAELESNDIPWWDCPLFLTYPDDHNHRFQGDLLINTPDFETVKIGEDGILDEFLLLACDGLWDVMDTDDAVRVVRDLLFRKKWTAKRAAARLAELAIHLGSSDNVTVIVVRLFSQGKQEM